jgi:hypothetical protein
MPIKKESGKSASGEGRLTTEQQQFIVMSLACYAKPSAVAAELKERFGVEVRNLSLISYYDPTNPASSHDLAKEWVDLFTETRRRYNTEIDRIPIASQAFRLLELTALLDHKFVLLSPELKAKILEQAAKERGGLYQRAITTEEVAALLAQTTERFTRAVEQHVTNPEEKERVISEVKQLLEEEGPEGSG